MKTKLLRIVRENFDVGNTEYFFFAYKKEPVLHAPIFSSSSFDFIVKMLEHIYPQGRHYAIMRRSRRFKQDRREKIMRIFEIVSVSSVVLIIMAILILNTCCGTGIQY